MQRAEKQPPRLFLKAFTHRGFDFFPGHDVVGGLFRAPPFCGQALSVELRPAVLRDYPPRCYPIALQPIINPSSLPAPSKPLSPRNAESLLDVFLGNEPASIALAETTLDGGAQFNLVDKLTPTHVIGQLLDQLAGGFFGLAG